MTSECEARARAALDGAAVASLLPAVDALPADLGEAWLVGGAVRDAVLGRRAHEVDLAILGDAHAFAAALAAAFGTTASRHDAFGTATIAGPGDVRIDLATARRERYPFPGALPAVEPTLLLEEDLARRDFSVNAVAVGLSPGVRGRVVDPFGGLPAIAAAELTVLHPRSFLDDPTRILRGLRYAVRLGFFFDDETAVRIDAAAAAAFDAVSGARILREIRLAADEPTFLEFVAALEPFGVARSLALAWRPGSSELLLGAIEGAIEQLAPSLPAPAPRLARLAGLWLGATADAATALGERLPFTTAELATFAAAERSAAAMDAVAGAARPSSVARALDPLPLPAIVLVGAFAGLRRAAGGTAGEDGEAVVARIGRYLAADRGRRPELDGRDVMRIVGSPPGPRVGRILAELRSALLDGEVSGREDEERYLAALAARTGDEAEGDEDDEDQERDDRGDA